MKLIVQKFGGSSVRDAERIRNVAGIIADTYGWNTVFYLIIGVGILGAVTFATMWLAPRDGYARSQAFYASEAKNVAEAEENIAINGD